MLLKAGLPLLGVLLAGPSVQASEAPPPTPELPENARHVLLQAFRPKAVYEEGVFVRREPVAPCPSPVGLGPSHPLLPLSLYQCALAEAHYRLMQDDPGYRDLFQRTWASMDLPLDISEYEGSEMLYRHFLGSGVYERLLAEAGPPPALPPGLVDPRGRTDKAFHKKVETDLPKVDFPPSLMIFRYCVDGVKYNAPPGDRYRDAHDRLVAKDGKYRDAIRGAMAGLDGVTASDARLTLQFRQALLDVGIDKLIEAEASKGGSP